MSMNVFLDADVIYDVGTKAISTSKFKYAAQLFERAKGIPMIYTLSLRAGMS